MEKMKYRYVAVYQILGLTHNPNKNDIEIYTKESNNTLVKAILTGDSDQHCYDIDRAFALGYLVMKGIRGQSERDAVNLEIAGIRKNRNKEMQGAEALIFKAEGETEANISRPHRETDDYVVGFDIINKDNVVSTYRDQINATLAALYLASDHTPIQIKQLRSDVYLINEHEKPVYSISFSGGGEGYSSMPTTAEFIKGAQGQLKLISKRALTKVCRLLTQAISRDNDELRRFMFGWAALEIFVKTVFSEYEKVFIQALLASDSASQAGRYFKRIREVMKGKYNIADQFVVVAACIGESSVEEDVAEFIKVKKIRDALFHDTSMAEKGLPTFVIVELLKKYLRLHLTYKSRSTPPSTQTLH
jgi:hypothetical protein